MPSPDYNNIQIIVAAREVEQQIVPLLKQQFPELLERAAVAVTGSASFGAADEFSDFDATVFLPDDDYPQWGEQLSQSLAELPSSHWAEVQDPDVHFCAMSYGKPWGMPLPSGAPERVDYKQICPETAWHFSRYVTLYDEGGHLERAKSIAWASFSTNHVRPSNRLASGRKRASVSTNRSARPSTPGRPSRSSKKGAELFS